MKRRKEWFNDLPEPERSQAFKNLKEFPSESAMNNKAWYIEIEDVMCLDMRSALWGFNSEKTAEGFSYWLDVEARYPVYIFNSSDVCESCGSPRRNCIC